MDTITFMGLGLTYVMFSIAAGFGIGLLVHVGVQIHKRN